MNKKNYSMHRLRNRPLAKLLFNLPSTFPFIAPLSGGLYSGHIPTPILRIIVKIKKPGLKGPGDKKSMFKPHP